MVKVKLELILNKNGVTFLNFWDSLEGKDVTCQVVDGKLMHRVFEGDNEEPTETEITLQEFIDKVHDQRRKYHEE